MNRARIISERSFESLIEKMRHYSYSHQRIPEYMHKPLACYIAEHRPVGHFLTALLSNDLFAACDRADGENILALPVYAGFLWNYAPLSCYGSKKNVKAWLKNPEGRKG